MSRLRAAHDRFVVDGGCTCPGTRTLFQARIEGHTAACTEGRRRKVEDARRQREALEQRPALISETSRRLRDAG